MSNAGNVGAVANPLKITDVIDDCLERIFMHLDYNDLLAIADANVELRSAANMVFQRKFSTKEYRLHVTRIQRQAIVTEKYVDVFDLKDALQLLRCFGNFITKLHIGTSQRNRDPIELNQDLDRVLRNTMEYCLESLVELSLNFIPNIVFDSMIAKPFLKVKYLAALNSKFGPETSNLSTYFPALRCLKLINCGFVSRDAIEKHFTRLKHLTIVGESTGSSKSIGKTLRLNPQLRSLYLNLSELAGLKLLVNRKSKITFKNDRVFIECQCHEHIPWHYNAN